MMSDIKGFWGASVKALGVGILGIGAIAIAVAGAVAFVALVMTIPAAILWYVLPLLGYTIDFYKIWAACIALKIVGGLLFNHNSIKVEKD